MTKLSRLKEIRMRKGFLQQELAELLGVPKSSLCVWEKQGFVPIKHIKAYAEALGISEDTLSDMYIKAKKRKKK